jgi:hypothetical protein
LIVIGDLSVTRIERSVMAEPTESYSGPEYVDPTAHTDTREITLVFSDPRQNAARNRTMHFLGTSSVNREDFPQSLDALTLDDWPTILVNDEKCVVPSLGEDYSGMTCTGTVIANVTNRVVSPGVGEAYYGFQPAVTPDRKQASIILDMKLQQDTVNAGENGN